MPMPWVGGSTLKILSQIILIFTIFRFLILTNSRPQSQSVADVCESQRVWVWIPVCVGVNPGMWVCVCNINALASFGVSMHTHHQYLCAVQGRSGTLLCEEPPSALFVKEVVNRFHHHQRDNSTDKTYAYLTKLNHGQYLTQWYAHKSFGKIRLLAIHTLDNDKKKIFCSVKDLELKMVSRREGF